jgi:hypothetical protein
VNRECAVDFSLGADVNKLLSAEAKLVHGFLESPATEQVARATSLLDPGIASAIERTKGVKQEGVRAGNWLLKEQANELRNVPDPSTHKTKRDRAILALLVSCGLCRAELVGLEVDKIQQREGRWVIPDLVGMQVLHHRRLPSPLSEEIPPTELYADGCGFGPMLLRDRDTQLSESVSTL